MDTGGIIQPHIKQIKAQKMRIGINLLYLAPSVIGGTLTYAVSLIKALSAIDKENEYVVFLNRESSDFRLPEAPNFRQIICRFSASRRVVRYTWEQIVLPIQLRRQGIHLVHSLGYVGPLRCPCLSVVTIHDLNYVALKNMIRTTRRLALRFFCTQSAKRCTHIITTSQFSKTQIVRFLKVNSCRITVTHLGPGWDFASNPSVSWDSVKKLYSLPSRYIVTFGGKSTHKNLASLVKAFGQLWADFPHYLVLIGNLPQSTHMSNEISGSQFSDRIVELGYVPKEHIKPILAHADVFVLPSLYEGFGLPVLEAQQAGVTLACSSAGSLPEVAGDGAFFFNPSFVSDMVNALRKCLQDRELGQSLTLKGYKNVERFSWERTARQTLNVYKQVLASDTRRS